MRLVLRVRQADYLGHHTGHILQLQRVDPTILRKSEGRHVHGHRQVVLHVQSIDCGANLRFVPPVDDNFDGVGAPGDNPDERRVVLPDLVDYLAQSLLVHLVVLGHHLVCIRIVHNKVVHVDASGLVDRGLNVGGAEV